MPIYEYECEKCGDVFEVFQKISDPPPKSHTCGSRKVRRIMSQTSFVLKGTGWYATDYAGKEKSTKDKDAGGNASTSSSDTGKSSSEDTSSSSDKSSKKGEGKKSSSGSSSESKSQRSAA